VPEDVTEDGVTYRFVNVAVAPESASKPARRKRAS
jgi:hypothetical protein